MAAERIEGPRRGMNWRLFGWGMAAFVLSLPLILRFPWTLGDFVVMGFMLGAAGLLIEAGMRLSSSWPFRLGAFFAVVAGFLLIWVNLAVGFLGDEDNLANVMYLGVLMIAVGGSAIGGFRASAMSIAMFAAAAAQLAAWILGATMGWGADNADTQVAEAAGTGIFTVLWLIPAGLFRRAAQEEQRPSRSG